MKIDLSKVTDIVFAGIDHRDAHDFVDAYIESADVNGRPATEEELDHMNNNAACAVWKYEKLMDYIY